MNARAEEYEAMARDALADGHPESAHVWATLAQAAATEQLVRVLEHVGARA